jgi:hypothetical protein
MGMGIYSLKQLKETLLSIFEIVYDLIDLFIHKHCLTCSGCRADANEAAVILLPSNITLFTLDFSGSGLSGGGFVSLGWHEVLSE